MFGHGGWRPLTVALLVSGALFLPQGVAEAASPGGSAQFVGPTAPRDDTHHDDANRTASASTASTASTSVAGASFDGSATAGPAATAVSAAAAPASSAPASSAPAPASSAPAPASSAPAPTAGGSTIAGSTTAGSTISGSAVAGSASAGSANGGTVVAGTVAQNPSTPAASAPVVSAPVPSVPVPSVTDPSNTVSSSTVPPTTDPSTSAPASDDWSTTSSTRPSSRSGSDDGTGDNNGRSRSGRHSRSSDSSGSSNDSKSGDSKSGDNTSGGSSSGNGSSGSSSSGSSASGSSSGDVSGGTTSATDPGASACPTTAGNSGTTSNTPSSAAGSVTVGATVPDSNTGGAASVTDITGATVGTVTRATTQALAAPAGTVSSGGSSVAGPVATAGTANLPGDLLNLGDWYLTLPTGQQGSPDTVQNPNLEKFTNEFFKLNPSRDGVEFSARGDGVTTKNSHYPRSELREMGPGGAKASWSNTSGSHVMDLCEAITKVPSAKPEVVAAQIHDDKDDVLQIRLEGTNLIALYGNGKSSAVLDPNYRLGTPYNVRITAANSKVDVAYNGQQKATLPLAGSGWYWKVGAYVQSNSSHGDGAASEGEVTVYSLNCVHS